MNELVLYYNPEKSPKTKKLKRVLTGMGIDFKIITPELTSQQLGYLAGVEGFPRQPAVKEIPDIPEEIMILHQFTSQRIDELLKTMRAEEIGTIDLKAIITIHNCTWTLDQLYKELKEEHEYMKNARKPPRENA